VTDSYGKVHGIENLYLSDASIFPTSLGYNPQVTIMALTTRNAEYILNHWN
jgi:choline dehydrogenase-like flavoprotein